MIVFLLSADHDVTSVINQSITLRPSIRLLQLQLTIHDSSNYSSSVVIMNHEIIPGSQFYSGLIGGSSTFEVPVPVSIPDAIQFFSLVWGWHDRIRLFLGCTTSSRIAVLVWLSFAQTGTKSTFHWPSLLLRKDRHTWQRLVFQLQRVRIAAGFFLADSSHHIRPGGDSGRQAVGDMIWHEMIWFMIYDYDSDIISLPMTWVLSRVGLMIESNRIIWIIC